MTKRNVVCIQNYRRLINHSAGLFFYYRSGEDELYMYVKLGRSFVEIIKIKLC